VIFKKPTLYLYEYARGPLEFLEEGDFADASEYTFVRFGDSAGQKTIAVYYLEDGAWKNLVTNTSLSMAHILFMMRGATKGNGSWIEYRIRPNARKLISAEKAKT